MKSNTEQLKIAQKYLGKGGATFRKYCGLPGGAAWCDAFVTYIFHEAGNSALFCNGKKQTYCPTTIKILQKEMAQIPLYLAMPSDVLFFDWDRNGTPNHIGFVRAKKSTSDIYTIEGNTDGGRVAQKTRAGKYVQGVFRPHFKGSFKLQKLTVDGECGYNTIANMQKMLGGITVDAILGIATVKRLQKYVAVSQDGSWGPATSKAVQKMLKANGCYSGAIDGEFGKNSVIGLQKYINKKLYSAKPTPAPTPTPTPKPTPKPAAKLTSRRIEIDLTNQIATVFGIYSDGTSKPIMSEFVSTASKGHTTPTGSFKIQGASGGRKAKLRTAKMSSGKAYAEFLCRFHGGKCMHTVPYKTRQTTGHVFKGEFNKLGKPASAGCVRMPWKLAHYIYENCPIGTPVKVFKGKAGSYPMGKPVKYMATSNVDPTYKK